MIIIYILIKLCSKSHEFSYKDIPEYYSMWKSFLMNITRWINCSFYYVLGQNSDPSKYKAIRQDTISYFIEFLLFLDQLNVV